MNIQGRTFKKNTHHYVPQFWLRGFAGSNGNIHAWDGKTVRILSAKNIMQENWLYTLFDHTWLPNDSLENSLSAIETHAAKLFTKVSDSNVKTTAEDRQELCEFIALQACRHPDVMKRGHERAKKLGLLLADAYKSSSVQDFVVQAAQFGVSETDAAALYQYLLAQDRDRLRSESEELANLSPQHYQLPQQLALTARTLVSEILKSMLFTLLDAPQGSAFILGDTPLPQSDLAKGFVLPICKSVAISGGQGPPTQSLMERRPATISEVNSINQTQWNNARTIVIGPNPQVFDALC